MYKQMANVSLSNTPNINQQGNEEDIRESTLSVHNNNININKKKKKKEEKTLNDEKEHFMLKRQIVS